MTDLALALSPDGGGGPATARHWLGRRAGEEALMDPEELRRAEVTLAELVEDHPDPDGEVKLWPLADHGIEPEDVDGW